MTRQIASSNPPPAALLLALLVAAPAAAPAQDEGSRFGEVVDVTLVNLEVWVTDRKGRPVTGLTAGDFEVREDGSPVPIAHFNEIGAFGAGPTQDAPGASPALDTGSAAGARSKPSPHWVFYFDQLHIGPTRLGRLVDDVRGFLEHSGIAPERVLVLRQGSDLVPEANFGSTAAELDAALARIAADEPGRGQRSALAKRLAVERLEQLWQVLELSAPSPCALFVRQAMTEVNRYSRESQERTAVTLANLEKTVSSLGAIPGVKTLVYAGDALETFPGRDLLRIVNELCPDRRDPGRFDLPEGLGASFGELTRGANANRVTIYSLQTSGLRPTELQGAEQSSLTIATAIGSVGPELRASDRSGLEVLALDTGGRAILNRNRFDTALEEIRDEMSSYYSLAYEPPHGGDGLEHRIEVEVRREGLATRHRRSYHDKSREERLVDRLKSALYLGVSENAMGLRLGAGDVTAIESGRYALRLHILVPSRNVVFLPREASTEAQLEATVAISDPERLRPEVVQRMLPVPKPPGDGTLLDLVVALELSVGPKVLAVALRDLATNEISYVSTTLDILPPERALTRPAPPG